MEGGSLTIYSASSGIRRIRYHPTDQATGKPDTTEKTHEKIATTSSEVTTRDGARIASFQAWELF